MQYSSIFNKRIGCSSADEVFAYLISTLKDTINKWDYFVNWKKVQSNLKKIEVDLNIMNYLIGKDDVEKEFKTLLKRHPSIAGTIPALIACRQDDFKILHDFSTDKFKYKCYTFARADRLTDDEISKVIEFASLIGLLDLLKTKEIKNLVDYMFGVEVGLDSNGRKNRGGTQMEEIIEFFIRDICKRTGYQYLKEATSSKVKTKWDLKMTVDKSSRKVDFAVFNGRKMYLVETNYYGGVGSKLKSTAGEYQRMYDYWKKDGHGFIWITDGFGWKSTRLPLQETFNYIDYILNLTMVEHDLLEDIVVNNL